MRGVLGKETPEALDRKGNVLHLHCRGGVLSLLSFEKIPRDVTQTTKPNESFLIFEPNCALSSISASVVYHCGIRPGELYRLMVPGCIVISHTPTQQPELS